MLLRATGPGDRITPLEREAATGAGSLITARAAGVQGPSGRGAFSFLRHPSVGRSHLPPLPPPFLSSPPPSKSRGPPLPPPEPDPIIFPAAARCRLHSGPLIIWNSNPDIPRLKLKTGLGFGAFKGRCRGEWRQTAAFSRGPNDEAVRAGLMKKKPCVF